MLNNIKERLFRNGLLVTICCVVILTAASTRLTSSMMVEISGYAALAILIANFTVYAFTQKKFMEQKYSGIYANVLAAIIVSSFILVGLCVLGMYFSKIDGIASVLPTM